MIYQGSNQAAEMARLSELRAYGILNTPSEPFFDAMVKRAALVFGVPIALVSFVDRDRQWFKARYGLVAEETPRTISFCTHAVEGTGIFVVHDARADKRFHKNPLVVSDPHMRFYAGAPLKTPSGRRLGTLCIIDRSPRHSFPDTARQKLEAMAGEVVIALEKRGGNAEMDQADRLRA